MKTHQEKLNELTEAIRKSIPRLMELSDGCVIKNERGTKYKIYYKENRYYNVFNDETVSSSIPKPLCKSYTIIGHEPLLNHVLEWLDTNKCDFSIRKEGFVFYRMDDLCMANWDLSKSKLSEQSPELIDFLHDLIPNK